MWIPQNPFEPEPLSVDTDLCSHMASLGDNVLMSRNIKPIVLGNLPINDDIKLSLSVCESRQLQNTSLCKDVAPYIENYANPVYGVVTVCHQVRCLRWGHPSLFHTTTSLLIWYKMLCVRYISYRLIWMEFINMFSVYAQSETHRRFNWWIIAVLTYNPSVLMCVEITDAPKL